MQIIHTSVKLLSQAKNIAMIAAATALIAGPLQVVAADSFTLGTSQYEKGDYAGAIVSLNKYLKTNQTSYQGHYMLANCYVQLRDLANGKRCYAMALANKPDNQIREHCLKAIERIAIASAPRPVQRPTTGLGKTTPEDKNTSDDKSDSPLAKKVEEECAKVMADAKIRADRIKEEQKLALEQYKEGHSRWWKRWTGDHWERIFDTRSEWDAEVTAPFEERIQKIMEDADHRCNGLRKDLK